MNSDTGLFSGLYQQTRECAELVDQVLIQIKDGTSSPKDKSRQELSKFLIHLGNNEWEDLSSRLIILVLRGKEDFAEAQWSRAGSALLSSEVDTSVVELLEQLARSLEQEQTGAMERMRGWVA